MKIFKVGIKIESYDADHYQYVKFFKEENEANEYRNELVEKHLGGRSVKNENRNHRCELCGNPTPYVRTESVFVEELDLL